MKHNRKLLSLLLLCGVFLLALAGCEEAPAPQTVAVQFDLGGAEGTAPEASEQILGESLTIPSCDAALENHFFGGWSDGVRYYYPGDLYTATEDVTLTARWIEKTAELVLQDCSEKSGWWGTGVTYEVSSLDNTTCVAAKPGEDGCAIFCYAWSNEPLDLSTFHRAGCGITFDLWVENPLSMTGTGRFELSAEMGAHPTSWDMRSFTWRQGWNTVRLDFHNVICDDADLSAINYIRLYLYSDPAKPSSLKMDNLRIFTDADPVNIRYETGYVADAPKVLTEQATLLAGSQVTLPENDFAKLHYDFAGWRDGKGNTLQPGDSYTADTDTVFTALWQEHPRYTISLDLDGGQGDFAPLSGYAGFYAYLPDTAPKKQGFVFAGWKLADKVYATGDILYLQAENATAKALWTPVLTEFTDGLVEAWQLNDGGLAGNVLSAIGKTDATHHWGTWLTSKTFGKTLDFSTTGSYMLSENTAADLSGDFTFAAWVKAPQRTLSHRTVFAYGEKYVPVPDEYTDFQTVDPMDKQGWSYCHLRKEGQMEGKGYYLTSTVSADTLFFINSFKSQDFTAYMEDGYIHMWVYAEHPENISGGALEFTSSGNCDKEEISFSVGSLELKEGWNEVYLPIAKAVRYGGDFRADQFNYVRFYFQTKGPVTIGIDDISLCRMVQKQEPDNIRLYLDAENAYALNFSMTGVTGITPAATSLDDGQWHHVMVSRAGNTLTYYVDGKEDGSCTLSGQSSVTGNCLVVGADIRYGYGFDGSMAEVKVYNKAKTPDQVTDMVIDSYDNQQHDTRLKLDRGLVFDRRQYLAPRPYDYELQTVTRDDIINAKNMGFDHVKLLLTPNHLINEDGSLKLENMEYITELVEYVMELDYVCYICVHPEKDFKAVYMGSWDNFELLCRWYSELAAYIGAKWDADHVGLQLMTEPGNQNTNKDWYWFSDRMWSAARNVLPEHTIITSSDAHGNLERMKLMSPATDDNLIYSFTTYEPYTIGWYFYGEHNNPNSFWKYLRKIPYPVEPGVDYTEEIEYAIGLVPEELKDNARNTLMAYIRGERDNHMVNNYSGTLYNRDWHFARAKSLDDWSNANGGNIHMMAVEWGCMHFSSAENIANGTGCPDEQRYEYIKDIRESFEAYDIGWSYWSYQEGHTVFLPDKFVRGESPDPVSAVYKFDWRLLEDCLGLTPLVEKP